LAALGWVIYFAIRRSFTRLLLSIFSLKSRVLRGAKLVVHSVTPVAAPAEREVHDEEPRDYVDVELTITPKNSEEGRVWEPSELILLSKKIRSLAQLEDGDYEVGTVYEVKVWDGKEFCPDDPGKYPGEQRLKLTFEVKPGSSRAWLHYYAETIGVVELPVNRDDIKRFRFSFLRPGLCNCCSWLGIILIGSMKALQRETPVMAAQSNGPAVVDQRVDRDGRTLNG